MLRIYAFFEYFCVSKAQQYEKNIITSRRGAFHCLVREQ